MAPRRVCRIPASARRPAVSAETSASSSSWGCSTSPRRRVAPAAAPRRLGRQPEGVGQGPVVLDPPSQPLPDPGRGVTGVADRAVHAGEPLQLVPGHRLTAACDELIGPGRWTRPADVGGAEPTLQHVTASPGRIGLIARDALVLVLFEHKMIK